MNSEIKETITLLTNVGIKGKEPFKLVGLLDASFCMSDMKNLGICIGIKNYTKIMDNIKYTIVIQVILVSDTFLIIDQVDGLVQMVFTVEEVLEDPDAMFDTVSESALTRYYKMKEEIEKRKKKAQNK